MTEDSGRLSSVALRGLQHCGQVGAGVLMTAPPFALVRAGSEESLRWLSVVPDDKDTYHWLKSAYPRAGSSPPPLTPRTPQPCRTTAQAPLVRVEMGPHVWPAEGMCLI